MTYNDKLRDVLDFTSREWLTMELLFGALKEDLSLKIIHTLPSEKDKREELYNITQAIDALAIVLQNCINESNKSDQGDE